MIYSQEQTNFPPLFESVGCICFSQGRILLLKRDSNKSYPFCWGIPGGKVEKDESRVRAMVRELFEETSILLSSENLSLIKTYHIITEEMSFLYTVYQCQFDSIPKVEIRREEHTRFGWFCPNKILTLELVSDLDLCLKDIFLDLRYKPTQLELFPLGYRLQSSAKFESSIINITQSDYWDKIKAGKPVYIAFGPPATGKTTTLKLMAKKNKNLQFIQNNTVLSKASRLNFYIRKAFEENDHSFFFHFQMEILPLRFLQVIEAPPHSLIDEAIFSVLAYSRALYWLQWMKEYEYQTFYYNYKIYFNMLPLPNTIFFFNCDINTIMKRIQQRGRKHEKNYSSAYVEALYLAFSEVANELSKTCNVVKIDTNKLRPQEIVKLYGPQNSD